MLNRGGTAHRISVPHSEAGTWSLEVAMHPGALDIVEICKFCERGGCNCASTRKLCNVHHGCQAQRRHPAG